MAADPATLERRLRRAYERLAICMQWLSQARERIAELETSNAAMLHVVQAAIGVVDNEDPANAKALTLYVPADVWGRLVAAAGDAGRLQSKELRGGTDDGDSGTFRAE